MCGSVLQCVAACCSVLQCVAMRRGVLQCVAACCSVRPMALENPLTFLLQCVAHLSCNKLQDVAICCSMFQILQYVALSFSGKLMARRKPQDSLLQCDAVCCSMLQCVSECCSVLQCETHGSRNPDTPIVVCCSALQYVALCCTVKWLVEPRWNPC